MVDAWQWWDDEVKSRGRPDHAAADLTDAQLLALLRDEDDRSRAEEKRLIAEELLHRLHGDRMASPPPRLR